MLDLFKSKYLCYLDLEKVLIFYYVVSMFLNSFNESIPGVVVSMKAYLVWLRYLLCVVVAGPSRDPRKTGAFSRPYKNRGRVRCVPSFITVKKFGNLNCQKVCYVSVFLSKEKVFLLTQFA